MGTRRHGQEGALAPHPLSRNVVKCFCALVVTAERSVDKLFMHYLHNLSSDSEGFAQTPNRIYPWMLLGDFRPQTPNLPTPEKNHAGAHASYINF